MSDNIQEKPDSLLEKVKEIQKSYKLVYDYKVSIEHAKAQINILHESIKFREKAIRCEEMVVLVLQSNEKEAQKLFDQYKKEQE